MSRVRIVKLLLMRGVALSLGILLAALTSKPSLAQAASSFKPYLAKRVERYYPNTSSAPKLRTRIIARASNGSTSERYDYEIGSTGHMGETTVVVDARAGKSLLLDHPTESVVTTYLSDREIRWHQADEDRCVDERVRPALTASDVGRSRILGYDTVKVTTDRGLGSVDESWVAPGLGCIALKEVQRSGASSWNEFEIVELTEAEPAASPFETPADYVERSPSELNALYVTRFGAPIWGEKRAMELDKRYYEHQSNRR